jgi:hypothetical protein
MCNVELVYLEQLCDNDVPGGPGGMFGLGGIPDDGPGGPCWPAMAPDNVRLIMLSSNYYIHMVIYLFKSNKMVISNVFNKQVSISFLTDEAVSSIFNKQVSKVFLQMRRLHRLAANAETVSQLHAYCSPGHRWADADTLEQVHHTGVSGREEAAAICWGGTARVTSASMSMEMRRDRLA